MELGLSMDSGEKFIGSFVSRCKQMIKRIPKGAGNEEVETTSQGNKMKTAFLKKSVNESQELIASKLTSLGK